MAETVEKAAEVPRAGGGGSEWRVEEWSSPAGLSRARRRERAWGGGEGGVLATDLQYCCARSRSPFACRLVLPPPRFHARGTVPRFLARWGMRLDVEG